MDDGGGGGMRRWFQGFYFRVNYIVPGTICIASGVEGYLSLAGCRKGSRGENMNLIASYFWCSSFLVKPVRVCASAYS